MRNSTGLSTDIRLLFKSNAAITTASQSEDRNHYREKHDGGGGDRVIRLFAYLNRLRSKLDLVGLSSRYVIGQCTDRDQRCSDHEQRTTTNFD